jgi:hypothetical protein
LAHASRRKFGDGWLCLLELEEEEEEHVGGRGAEDVECMLMPRFSVYTR